VIARLEGIVGAPLLELEELKHKAGRRRTLRATGPRGSAIVKQYTSGRAETVAARVGALAAGPPEPVVPRVLLCAPELHLVVLSEVPGRPLRCALLDADEEECRRAGAALAAWHLAWAGRAPAPLRLHTPARELQVLRRRAEAAPPPVAAAVWEVMDGPPETWVCSTVVHRDLYEEQVMLGARVGLIDLDDAALGPPELDLGNLLAHVDLLELRSGRELAPIADEILAGYDEGGGTLDGELLRRCRSLARLRLACIHRELRLSRDPLRPPRVRA
jgi:Ser/Thr protein kinase RdoA (MazF antagonist)